MPANTTARVTLPGSDSAPIEVSSGHWHWSIPYQDPDARGSFTVDDLTSDIVSDQCAWDIVMGVLLQVGAPQFVMDFIFSEKNIPLRQSLRMLPNYEGTVKIMNDALTAL